MTIPDEVRREVEAVLGAIRGTASVGGGCVSEARRVDLDSRVAFLKYDLSAFPEMFEAEAEGLRELRAAGTSLVVPDVLGLGERWLVLEWIEQGRGAPAAEDQLGRGLAELHQVRPEGWGWHRDGFIGPLPQDNRPMSEWAEFWRARRLEPQLRRARDAGASVGSDSEWSRLFAALPDALAAAEDEGPSLLHGDLWSGNAMFTRGGEAALVDPATYHGHREVDLAMGDLFGGFGPGVRAAYVEALPLAPGYLEIRRGIYQLYYLLVHVNLFGGGYAARTRHVLEGALREIRG